MGPTVRPVRSQYELVNHNIQLVKANVNGQYRMGTLASQAYGCSVTVNFTELFWPPTKLPLNFRKPENNSLLGWKNTKEMIINHKGAKIAKDGEDLHGLQKTNLKNLGYTLQMRKAYEESVPIRTSILTSVLNAHKLEREQKIRRSKGYEFGKSFSHGNACMLRRLINKTQNKTTAPCNHQDHNNQAAYHTNDIPWTQSLPC